MKISQKMMKIMGTTNGLTKIMNGPGQLPSLTAGLFLPEPKTTRRGYVETDAREFSEESIIILRKAQKEVHYLLNQGYPLDNAVTFVGNHYMLSNRQRTALSRATSSTASITERKRKGVVSTSGAYLAIRTLQL